MYPTGVESHFGKLRIWFMYQGKRMREHLAIPDTPKNRKIAGEMRQAIVYEIKTGRFDYAKHFPDSKHVKQSLNRIKTITLQDLIDKFLNAKKFDVSLKTLRDTRSQINGFKDYFDANADIRFITPELALDYRNDQISGTYLDVNKRTKSGRSASTVNQKVKRLDQMFNFAVQMKYLESNPFSNIKPLKQSKEKPTPLSYDEYQRLIDRCDDEQFKNFITLAVYTGMRHGELYSLAWEDIDLVKGIISVRRNITQKGDFVLPKTNAGIRTISLLNNAKNALLRQREHTAMMNPRSIQVSLRGYNQFRSEEITPVFLRKEINGQRNLFSSSLLERWINLFKKAGVVRRKPYQTRHTFACWMLGAGANPSFIASQMGHSSAQMVYEVYGDWMNENSKSQIDRLDSVFSNNAPLMPLSNSINV